MSLLCLTCTEGMGLLPCVIIIIISIIDISQILCQRHFIQSQYSHLQYNESSLYTEHFKYKTDIACT